MTDPNEATPPIEVSPEETSTNFFWQFGKQEVFNLQTTIRGNPTAEEINEHVASALEAMTQIIARGGHAKAGGKGDSFPNLIPASSSATQSAIETGKAVVPPPPTAPTPAGGAVAGRGESRCLMIEIGKTYQGDKTQLKFQCNGMEHPLTFAKSEADMVKLLTPLGYTSAHIVRGQKYPADCLVTWEQGEKYKNVISVKPYTG